MKLTIDSRYNVTWSMLGEESVSAGRLGVETVAENAGVPLATAARACIDEVLFAALKNGKLQPWDTLHLLDSQFALQVPAHDQRCPM